MSFQHTVIAGYLSRDPETRYLTSGDPVCNFSIPVSEKWKDKDSGETKERTVWFNCVCYKKVAEIAGEYLKKGSFPIVSGKITTGEYENKDGAMVKTWSLVVDNLDLGPRVAERADGGQTEQPRRQAAPARAPSKAGDADLPFDDDIPF
jgi:single-strand DNA-binding protein